VAKSTGINFTVSSLDKLHIPSKGIVTYKDTKFPALSIYVTSTGVKTFFVRKRVKGKDERLIIGRFPEIKIEQARTKAAVFCGMVADKKDPKAEERREKLDRLTFGEHFNEYLERYSKPHKKSWKYDYDEVNRYLSHWFDKRLSDIKKSDVERLHEKLGRENGRPQANNVLKRLRTIYNKAIEWNWKGENPTLGIKKFKEISRDRFIQPGEMPFILAALNAEQNETLKDYIAMLFYTGARKTNTLTMRWEHINFERQEWRIPDTKNGEPLTVPLVKNAYNILSKRKVTTQSQWVFPQEEDNKKHIIDPIKAWHRILGKATLNLWNQDPNIAKWIKKNEWKLLSYLSDINKVKRLIAIAEEQRDIELPKALIDIRIHDIRRTFGSYQALTGASLPVIGKSLGHKSMKSTQIYARLNLDPVRASIEKATEAMLTRS